MLHTVFIFYNKQTKEKFKQVHNNVVVSVFDPQPGHIHTKWTKRPYRGLPDYRICHLSPYHFIDKTKQYKIASARSGVISALGLVWHDRHTPTLGGAVARKCRSKSRM